MKCFQVWLMCLVIPFALVACDEKEESKNPPDGEGSGAAQREYTHEAIATEAFGYLEEAMGSFFAIKDKDDAKACLAKVKEVEPKIQAMVDRAKVLPAPTEAEKAAIQVIAIAAQDRIGAVKKERDREVDEEFKKKYLSQLNSLNAQGFEAWKKQLKDSENLVEHDDSFRKTMDAFESFGEIYGL